MADEKNHDTHRDTHVTRETHVEKSGGGGMPFILGGVVVAILVIAYVLFGMGGGEPAGDAGGDTNVNIEAPETESSGGEAEAPAADGGEEAAEPAN